MEDEHYVERDVIRRRLLAEARDGTPKTLKYFYDHHGLTSSWPNDDGGVLYNSLLSGNTDVAKYVLSGQCSFLRITKASCRNCLPLAHALGDEEIVKKLSQEDISVDAKDGMSKESTELCDAVRSENAELVESLLKQGVSVNLADGTGRTPLHIAVERGTSSTAIVQMLLEAGASVYATTGTDQTCLHFAVKFNRLEIAKLLVNKGAWVNARTVHGLTPLHLACISGFDDIVAFLVSKGADLSAEAALTGWAPLHFAVEVGKKALVDSLISCGTDVDHYLKRDGKSDSLSFLHIAAKKGHAAIAQVLVENGANVCHMINCDGYFLSPLGVAVDKGFADIAELLLKTGKCNEADTNARNGLLRTAVRKNNQKMAEVLLTGGEDVLGPNATHYALLDAAESGNKEMVTFLLSNGAQLNEAVPDSNTPLSAAAKENRKEIVEMFLSLGADVNADAGTLGTALHVAAAKGNTSIVELLLTKGSCVNTLSKEFATPLYCAAASGSEDIVDILIKNGASVDSESEDFGNPLHAAAARGDENIVRLLLKMGAKVDQHSELYGTPLHAALGGAVNSFRFWLFLGLCPKNTYGNMEIVELLLSNGSCVDLKSKGLGHPLHVAAFSGREDIVNLLLKHGADINAVNNDTDQSTSKYKGTALCIAVRERRRNLVCSLLNHTTPVIINESNREAVSFAIKSHYQEYDDIIERLLNYAFGLKAQDACNPNVLKIALSNERVKLVEEIFKIRPPENMGSVSASLCDAALGGCRSIATLNKFGVDINEKDQEGRTLLHLLALGKTSKTGLEKIPVTFHWLLDRRVRVDERANNGKTPLHYAAEYSFPDLVELLVGKVADIDAVDNEGFTPLHSVLDLKHKTIESDVIKSATILISRGANVNAKSKDGKTPLHFAAHCSSVVELLLEKGADINALDNTGSSALHSAAMMSLTKDSCCYKNIIKSTQLFLDKGADIEIKTVDGHTPLHWACKNGGVELVAVLLRYCLRLSPERSLINAATEQGSTPLHYAAGIPELYRRNQLNEGDKKDKLFPHYSADLYEISNMLLRSGANVNAADNQYTTPLHIAAKSEEGKLISLFVKYGADVNARDINGNTALHIAASHDASKEVVESLLGHGGDFNAQNNDGASPLNCCEGSRQETFNCLLEHVMKMKVAGIEVSEQNDLHLKSDVYESQCQNEVLLLLQKISESEWSYHDILSTSSNRLVRISQNKDIWTRVNSDGFKTEFPVYGPVIFAKLWKGRERSILLENCHKIWQTFFSQRAVCMLPELVDHICSFVPYTDLHVFVNTFYPRSDCNF